jgi:acyl-coenzyme A thioesterase PaaI-like protein
MHETGPAVQDFYPEDVAHCFGCGKLNDSGHQLKTRWEGEETVSVFTPRPEHTAIPGYVYGGLIASLIDCHGTGTGAAAAARAAGWTPSEGPPPSGFVPRFVTASLKVDYLRPTPLGPPLEIRGKVREATDRKVVVDATVTADGVVTARGSVVAVRMPESMIRRSPGS